MEYAQWYDNSPVGRLFLTSDGEALTGLWFSGFQRFFDSSRTENVTQRSIPVLDEARQWLDIYFQGKDPGPIPAVNPQVTAFRREVCEIMCGIPYGETATYGSIAKELAARRGKKSMSSQAVGGAVGHNPIGIIIPCHRVVGASGKLTGYGGGMDRKIALLELEGFDMSQFTWDTAAAGEGMELTHATR